MVRNPNCGERDAVIRLLCELCCPSNFSHGLIGVLKFNVNKVLVPSRERLNPKLLNPGRPFNQLGQVMKLTPVVRTSSPFKNRCVRTLGGALCQECLVGFGNHAAPNFTNKALEVCEHKIVVSI